MGLLFNKTKVKKSVRTLPNFRPGQRLPASEVRGGGGPANAGARSDRIANKLQPNFRDANAVLQLPWSGEFESQEYVGFAAPATTPITAGMKPNEFRNLGDNHGGRG